MRSTFGKDWTAMSKRSEKLREKRIARDAARQALQRGDSVSAQRVAASKVAAMALASFNNKGFFSRFYSIIPGSATDTQTLCISLTDVPGGSAQGQRVGRTISVSSLHFEGMMGLGGLNVFPGYYNDDIQERGKDVTDSGVDTQIRIATITAALVVCGVTPRDATRSVGNRTCIRWDEVFDPVNDATRPYRPPMRDHAGNSTNYKVLKVWTFMSTLNTAFRNQPKRLRYYKRFKEPMRIGFTGTGADVLAGSTNQLFLMVCSNYFGNIAADGDTVKPFIQMHSEISYDQ